jgi:hypothetical protein
MSDNHNDSFANKFRDQLQSHAFRSTVKDIIKDETVVKDLVKDLTNLNRLSFHVNEELKSKLPNEVKRIANPLVDRKLEKFTSKSLPYLVNNQLTYQIPIFLNNQPQMKAIIDKQTNDLEQKLTVTANNIMTKVVNEPKFNTLSTLHFKEIDRKNDEKMTIIENKLSNDVKSNKNEIEVLNNRHNEFANAFNGLLALTMFNTFLIIGTIGLGLTYGSNNIIINGRNKNNRS